MSDSRGQSEVVGVALLIGVITTVVLLVGVFVFLGDSGQRQEETLAEIEIDGTSEKLELAHAGGDGINASDLRVSLQGDNENSQFVVDAGNVSGSDAVFEVGDTITREHGRSGDTLRVIVVHTPSNTVIGEGTVDISGDDSTPAPFALIWETAADWDNATATDGSLAHTDAGDQRSDEAQLGHPADSDGIVAYWPFDEAAGASTATDASPFSNDGAVDGATAGQTGVFGTTAYQFDGTSAVVNVSDSGSLDTIASTDAFTFGTWVNTNDTSEEAPLLSQYDGIQPGSDGDLRVALRNGSLSVLLGDDGAIEQQQTVETDADWQSGSGTDIIVGNDTLSLQKNGGVAQGQFSVPSSLVPVSETVGFEPDLVVFRTVITDRPFNDTATVGGRPLGDGRGFADCSGSGCQEVSQSFGTGSSSPNGYSASSSGNYSIYQVVPPSDDGTGSPDVIEGSVTSTNTDGFTVQFDEVTSGPTVQVVYSAYAFPSGTDVDVGSFQTLDASGSNPTGTQEVLAGFEPNYVHAVTGPSLTGLGDTETSESDSFGRSEGWSIKNESRSLAPQQTRVGETGTVSPSAESELLGETGTVDFEPTMGTEVVGETGTVTTSDGTWQTVSFQQSYADPVVVGSVNTENEAEHGTTFDAKNVTADSAEVRVCEAEGATNGCDTHATETAGYVVIDASKTDDVDGIEAGTINVSGDYDGGDRESVSYSGPFGSTPVVFGNVQTTNDGTEQPVETRVTSTGVNGFTVGICHLGSTDSCDASRGQEEVGWVALEPGSSPFDQTSELGTVGTGGSNWETESLSAPFTNDPAVVVSTQTENGGQEVQIDEARTVGTGSIDVRFCEIEGNQPDACDTHTGESVGWLAVEAGTTLTRTTITDTWETVSFTNSYSDPVVVGTVNSENESEHALTFDAKNVTADSAEVRVCETKGATNGCDAHATETVGYVVVNASKAQSVSGIEAGTVNVSGNYDGGDRQTISYSGTFGSTPVVFGNVQTTNDGTEQPVETRVTDTGTGSFTVGICHQGSTDNCDASRSQEEVGWIALEPGSSPFDQTSELGTVGTDGSDWETESLSAPFTNDPAVVVSTQTENGGQEVQIDEARTVGTGSIDVRFCEIEGTSNPDTCDTHTGESVGWLAIEAGTNLTTTTATDPWINVSFSNTYSDPVVVGTVNSENESEHALTFDAKNVTADSAEVRVCETQGSTDGCDGHAPETIGYVVVDAAKADEVDGLEAGTIDLDQGIDDRRESVRFGDIYGSTPVVFANVQTTTGAQPVEARVTDTSQFDFQVGICHLDGVDTCDSGHGTETVGWVSLPTGSVPFDQAGEVGETGNVVTSSQWERQTYSGSTSFSGEPTVVVSTQTEDSGEELQVDEARNVTNTTAEVRYCEIEGNQPDACDTHTDENVGWLAIENDTTLTATSQDLRRQVVMSQSAYADDINYHVFAASESELIHTLWAKNTASGASDAITGRVTASLLNYTDSGFTLDYTANDPDGQDQSLVLYAAVNLSSGHPELGYETTPTNASTQNLSVSQAVTDLTFTATNTIPGVGIEDWSGQNDADNHLGWMYGVGNASGGDAVAVGYGSHSSSVNEHATGSRTDPFYLLYADQNGNVLGRDEAVISNVTASNVTLDWQNVTNTSTSGVAYDSVLYVYRSFGLDSSYANESEWLSKTYDVGKPVVWNRTTVDADTPSGTDVEIDYSDGSDWYDDLASVPRSQQLQYNVTLTGGSDTPVVDWLNTSYLSRSVTKQWTTETDSEFDSGTFTGTTTTGDGDVTLSGSPVFGEAGTVTTSDGQWVTVSFQESYTTPVVVGTTNTKNDNGQNALSFAARNVQSDSAEVRVCETEGTTDGCDTHGEETVGYVVIDAAAVTSDDSDGIDAGTVDVDGELDSTTRTVSFGENFGNNPVVLANTQTTTTGAQPVEGRVRDRDTGSFAVGLCHQDSEDGCDAGRARETVGWIALEPSALPFAQQAEVGTTDTVVANSEWEPQSFGPSFDSAPVAVASTLTQQGGQDALVDEVRSVTTSGLDVRYCEIGASDPDGCDTHLSNNVGWFAVEPGLLYESYASSGEYRSQTFDAGRRVNWTDVNVSGTVPSGTTLDVNYSDGTGWYDDLADVPDSRTLQFNASFSRTTTGETPRLDNVTVTYNATGWRGLGRSVADGRWHHVAVTYDGAQLGLYTDGQRRRAVSVGTSLDPADTTRQLGGETRNGTFYDGRLDAPRLYNRSLAQDEVRALYNATTNGTITVLRKSFRIEIAPSNLRLTNVSASVPTDTSLDVVVESDPNEDDSFEETSDIITLNGSSSYGVSGLSQASRTYRLRVTFESTDPTKTAVLDEAELRGGI